MKVLEKFPRELNLGLSEITSEGSKDAVNKDPGWLNDLAYPGGIEIFSW